MFSSGLVQVKHDGGSDGQSTRLVVAYQFWICVGHVGMDGHYFWLLELLKRENDDGVSTRS